MLKDLPALVVCLHIPAADVKRGGHRCNCKTCWRSWVNTESNAFCFCVSAAAAVINEFESTAPALTCTHSPATPRWAERWVLVCEPGWEQAQSSCLGENQVLLKRLSELSSCWNARVKHGCPFPAACNREILEGKSSAVR